MAQTIFDYPVDLTEAWENGSVYTFFLKTGEGDAKAAKGAPVFLHGTPAQGGGSFRPNLVVSREAKAGRDLEAYAAEQRQAMQTRLPSAKLVKEGKARVAGLDAVEREYQVALDRPLPTLGQWHASLERDGWFYHFCGTTPKERFEKDKKEFIALVASWKPGK